MRESLVQTAAAYALGLAAWAGWCALRGGDRPRLSLAVPSAFSDESVWSAFGAGYGFLPLLLPPLGLWWLVSAHARYGPEP